MSTHSKKPDVSNEAVLLGSLIMIVVLMFLAWSAFVEKKSDQPKAAETTTVSKVVVIADINPVLAAAKRKQKEANERAKQGLDTGAFNPEKEGPIKVGGR